MKTKLSIGILLLYSHICFAQNEVKVNLVNVDLMGRSVRVDYRKPVKKHVWYGGISYLINPRYNELAWGATLTRKAYAKEFSQRFMLTVGYERRFRFTSGNVLLSPLLELTVAKTGMKAETMWPPPDTKIPMTLVRTYNFVYPRTTAFWLVGHIGISAEIPLYKNISVTQQLGFSPAFVRIKDDQYIQGGLQELVVKYTEAGILDPFYAMGVIYKF